MPSKSEYVNTKHKPPAGVRNIHNSDSESGAVEQYLWRDDEELFVATIVTMIGCRRISLV